VEQCGPCPVYVSFTLAFALQLRKKQRKTSVKVFSPTDAKLHITKGNFEFTLEFTLEQLQRVSQ